MALKFLNKKGWHTGSLRNIENVWKAEQKRDAEDKKLEELRKQIHEERDRAEFRLLQEQAGLVPKQERLDFLYESGLAVGKASASDGFKALEDLPSKTEAAPSSSSAAAAAVPQSEAPGALFEEKPQSANDAWRKLHSDPLLMIRQREQEALARVKNNPVQMALIRKSIEEKKQKKKKKHKKKSRDEKEHKSKRRHKHEDELLSGSDGEEQRSRKLRNSSYRNKDSDSEDNEQNRRGVRAEKKGNQSSKYREQSPRDQSDPESLREKDNFRSSKQRERSPRGRSDREAVRERRDLQGNDKLDKEHRRSSDRRDRRNVQDIDRSERETYRRSKQLERSPLGDRLDQDTAREGHDLHRNHKASKESHHQSSKRRDASPPGRRSHQESLREKQDPCGNERSERENHRTLNHRERSPSSRYDRETARDRRDLRSDENKAEKETSRSSKPLERESYRSQSDHKTVKLPNRESERTSERNSGPGNQEEERKERRRGGAPKLSEEERAARLREMQMDAEVHEEQRWKRLKRADEDEAVEASRAATAKGKNFLDEAQRSTFGTEKGGSASIAESVRRRTHYSQAGSDNGNAFRR